MEEPNNYPSSCIWHETTKKSQITNIFLKTFYKKANGKLNLIEDQINRFKRINKKIVIGYD